jgi:hypothetical protein
MFSVDLSQSFGSAKSRLNSIKSFNDVSKSIKDLNRTSANSFSESAGVVSSQLSQISNSQKRFQRDTPTSTDQLLDLISIGKGSGSDTVKYLRRKILEAAAKIEPELQEILSKEVFKAIGCSQEQTYIGIPKERLEISPLPTLPESDGIYIPLQSLDFFSNLKNSPTSQIGKVYYEKNTPSTDSKYIPFGGNLKFPMNKQLYDLTDSLNVGRSFATINGKNYQGESLQNLFDIQYTKTNEFGISGDFFRVALIDRKDSEGNPLNTIGTFIGDYYKTINLIDPVDIGSQITNILSGAIDIKAQSGFGQLNQKTRFQLLIERILGLCFDSRREIDVSGISKIAELDGVDDDFFKLNEVDLRNIDSEIYNIQKGVMEFVDCENVKLPVNSNTIVDELIKFREASDTLTDNEVVEQLEKVIDSVYQNPQWENLIPNNFNVQVAIDKSVIKKIPLAIAAGVLTPKVLLPIFIGLGVVKNKASVTYNQIVNPNNNNISTTNNLLGQANNIVTDAVDFVEKFKSFTIELVSKIGEIFLKTLFEILKKDIINLISLVLTDISNSKIGKKYAMILKLLNFALIIGKLISDYRKCKSLVDEILLLLNLINGKNITGQLEIPLPLLALSSFLPGTSPERSTINVIEILQSAGVPTGALPDGSPNLMLLYNLATTKGIDKEMSENGKVEIVLNPKLPISGVGKFF